MWSLTLVTVVRIKIYWTNWVFVVLLFSHARNNPASKILYGNDIHMTFAEVMRARATRDATPTVMLGRAHGPTSVRGYDADGTCSIASERGTATSARNLHRHCIDSANHKRSLSWWEVTRMKNNSIRINNRKNTTKFKKMRSQINE